MDFDFWKGDFSIRIHQIAALKASDIIYKVLEDYYEEGTNLMKIILLYDGIEVDRLVHETLKNDSRPLIEKEMDWAKRKLSAGVKEEDVEISY